MPATTRALYPEQVRLWVSGYVHWSPGPLERERFAHAHHAGRDSFFPAYAAGPRIAGSGRLVGAFTDDREAGQIGVGASTDVGVFRRVEAIHEEAGG